MLAIMVIIVIVVMAKTTSVEIQVFWLPKIRLHPGPQGGAEVVEVHQGVDARVQVGTEGAVSTTNKSGDMYGDFD